MPIGPLKMADPLLNQPTPSKERLNTMTRTVVESKTKTAIIGFDEPFCVIGERINPTGRKILAEELERGDFSRVEADAIAQDAAGANILDVNSGAVFSNKMAEDPRYADNNFVEPMLMPELIRVVQNVVDIPLCIDSSVPGALEAGLEACEGRPLLNSVTGEKSGWSSCCHWSRNTTCRWLRSRTTTRAFPKIPTCVSTLPRRS